MNYKQNLNRYLADLMVLNVKFHNLHWNVKGIHFMAIHQFTESQYESFFEKYDEVAELLKIRSEKPLITLKSYLAEASIIETEADSFSGQEVLSIASESLKSLRASALEIRRLADEADDAGVVAVMEDHVADYDKNIWFLAAMLEG